MKPFIAGIAALLIAGLNPPTGDLESSFQSLKEAESKKDVLLIKTLGAETCALARQAASEPAPESGADREAWAQRIARARDIELYTEYALYSTAVQSQPAVTVNLLSALEQQNPKSKYLDDGYGHYFRALVPTGGASKIPAIAEKAIAHFPENEDLLLVLSDEAMNRKRYDLAQSYAERLLATLRRHALPEGMAPADWQRKKNAAMGRSHWIAGIMHCEKSQFSEGDKDLRAALPLIQGNEAMLAPALFHLGVANYQLSRFTGDKARLLDGMKYSEQAAAIKGPLAEQAWRNAQAMKAELKRMR